MMYVTPVLSVAVEPSVKQIVHSQRLAVIMKFKCSQGEEFSAVDSFIFHRIWGMVILWIVKGN